MKKIISKYSVLIIFLIFLFFLLFQHKFVYIYHDDYGYASLSYAVNAGVSGLNYNLNDILNFLGQHYNLWGGRVLYFFIEIVLLHTGINAFRIAQSLVIFSIFFLIYLILKDKFKISKWKIALMSISIYGIFNVFIFRTGIFWASASVLYIFPILPLLLFIYLYDKYDLSKFNNKLKKTLFKALMIVLIIFSTFSQEQIAVATLSYLFFITFFDYIKTKKINKFNILLILVSIIFFLVLFLAPGNSIRMLHPTSIDFYKLSFIEKIKKNIPEIIFGNFNQYNIYFTISAFMSFTYISYKNIKKNIGIKIINMISFLSSSMILFATACTSSGYFGYFYYLSSNHIYNFIVMILYVIQIILVVYSTIVYFINLKEERFLSLFLAAILSQIAMLMSPYFPYRASIIFELVVSIIFLYILFKSFEKIEKRFHIYVILLFFILSFINLFSITLGYYKNSYTNDYNNKKLSDISKQLKSGYEVNEIVLKKLPDLTYSGDQPYTKGNDYILNWIYEYYDIPNNVSIIYED